MRALDLQLDLLDAIERMTGAEHAAMLLHMEPLERQTMMLASRDPGATIPELASEEAAWALATCHDEDLRDTHGVTVLPGSDDDSTILRVAFKRLLAQPRSQRRTVAERRREPDIKTAPPNDGAMWIGLRRARHITRLIEELEQGIAAGAPRQTEPGSLTGVCMRMAWSVYHLARLLQDPVSQLPGRMELQVYLKRAIAAGRRNRQAIGLMLVNPDDFTMINHRYGRREGDAAVREVAAQLQACLRQTDGVFHYGGAVFAAVLPATDLDQCRSATTKVRRQLTTHRYVDGTVPLTFSIGAAVASAQDLGDEPGCESELSQRADAALNHARLSGGARVVIADVTDDDSTTGALLNPLSGIFAADTEKDYRNMLLLWETVALISTQTVPESIASAFVDRLAIGFRPDRAALFSVNGEDIDTLATNVRDDTAPDGRSSERAVTLDPSQRKLVFEALRTGRVARTRHQRDRQTDFSAYAVPLIAREATLACLYLDANGKRLELDSSDVVFLNALATQMAVAMDRAELAARWIQQKDRESRLLREEVRELRQAIHHSKLVYQSDAMHALMQTVRRVAPSDATVLIVGESGTGKEMLAQSLHEFSGRRDAPFVVFDCGAVAHSLLEAELFGHKKGAFTGAESASVGRIAQAAGGTLFLDEVGELPLSVQAKLLRFVQEKEFSPVGGAERQRVDVRIVAATNRELENEVGAGRFRSDLYYRLRVIAVNAIPLRERRDDILPLARYFLEKFAAQYTAPTHRFSAAAQTKLMDYHWPGNVRELQNCVLRAVLTQDGEVLDAPALELFPESTAGGLASAGRPNEPAPGAAPLVPSGSEDHSRDDDPWCVLQRELERQVAAAVIQDSKRPAPIGRWLSEDMVLAANEICSNVARRAATLVGLPESTFRRQLEKASSGARTGTDFRPETWASIQPTIRRVIEHANAARTSQGNILERARNALLTCVRAAAAVRPSAGAALMGVTPPTYKRWLTTREQIS